MLELVLVLEYVMELEKVGKDNHMMLDRPVVDLDSVGLQYMLILELEIRDTGR